MTTIFIRVTTYLLMMSRLLMIKYYVVKEWSEHQVIKVKEMSLS